MIVSNYLNLLIENNRHKLAFKIIHLRLQNLVFNTLLPFYSYPRGELLSNTFQKRRVSSADAVQTVVLSGAMTICKTLWE